MHAVYEYINSHAIRIPREHVFFRLQLKNLIKLSFELPLVRIEIPRCRITSGFPWDHKETIALIECHKKKAAYSGHNLIP